MRPADVILGVNLVLGAVLTALLAVLAKDAPAWWGAAAPALGAYMALAFGVLFKSDKNPVRKLAQGALAALRASLALNVVAALILVAANGGLGLLLWNKAKAPDGYYRLVVYRGPVNVTGLTIIFRVLTPPERKGSRELDTDVDGMVEYPARIGDLLVIRIRDADGRIATIKRALTLTAETLEKSESFDLADLKGEDWAAPTPAAPEGAPVGFVEAKALQVKGVVGTPHGSNTMLARLAPLGPLPRAEAVLAHEAYVIGYNPGARQARWVAYEVRRAAPGVERRDVFTADPLAPAGQQATVADYRGSGYDRGNLVRIRDIADTQDHMDSAFYFTAVSPQTPALNRNLWSWLERYSTERLAPDGTNRVFIFRGPVYLDAEAPVRGKFLTIGANRIPIATHFFQIMAVQGGDGRLTLECFMAPNIQAQWNTANGRQAAVDAYRTSRQRIEAATGLKFFEGRPVLDQACR